MLCNVRIALGLAACWVCVPSVVGQEPPEKPKAKVEFRWLESKQIPDLTEEKGIRTTCGDQLSYLHKQPIFSNQDVAETRLRQHDLEGPLGVQFSVELHLTEEAKKKLATACDDNRAKLLAIIVDGKYLSSWYFDPSKRTEFLPWAGYIRSKSEAEGIVEACNRKVRGLDPSKEKK